MDPSREAGHLSAKFIAAYSKREASAAEHNARMDSPTTPLQPSRRLRVMWVVKALAGKRAEGAADRDLGSKEEAQRSSSSTSGFSARRATFEHEWRTHSGRKSASIVWSLNDTMTGFWAGGLFKVLGDTATLMSPLLSKALIEYADSVYAANHGGPAAPNIGHGVGLAIGLFCLTILASVCQHQFFFRSMCIGVLSRATLISATYKRVMRLTVKSRAQHPQGKVMNHLSSDISRIDMCAQWFHAIWTAPIQLLITMILLLLQIGPSALVGMSLFVLIAPLQTFFMGLSYKVRQRSMVFTDGRSKLLQELLGT